MVTFPRPKPGKIMMKWHKPRSEYADLTPKNARRKPNNPRAAQHWRHLLISWAGPFAFYRNRWFYRDRYYKHRIEKPIDAYWPNLRQIYVADYQKTLVERLKDLEEENSQTFRVPVDIGLDFQRRVIPREEFAAWKERRSELEDPARHLKLKIPVSEVNNDYCTRTQFLMDTARHHNIFSDLFHPDAYFFPKIPLKVRYHREKSAIPVFCGNELLPKDAQEKPIVRFSPASPAGEEKHEASFWTLLMVNPDGNPLHENHDMVHWLVSNIPVNGMEDGDVAKGTEVIDYIPPLPFYGTGFHRFIFVLFKQENGRVSDEVLNGWKLKGKGEDGNGFEERNWCTQEWYKQNEDHVTPGGLCWAQSEWDMSVKSYIHDVFGCLEPQYDYEWPVFELKEQKDWPHFPQAFDRYFDKYRPEYDVEEEVLEKRLSLQGPFDENHKRSEYPNVHWHETHNFSSDWENVQRRKQNNGVGVWRGLYENRIR